MVIWTTRWLRKGQAMALYPKQIHWHQWIYWAYSMSEIIICIQTSLKVGASRLTRILPKFELFPAGTWGLRTWRRVSRWKIWWVLKMRSLKSYVKSKRFHLEWLNKSLSNREAMKAKGWFLILISLSWSGSEPDKLGSSYSSSDWKELGTKLPFPRICPHYFTRRPDSGQDLGVKFWNSWGHTGGEYACLH